MTEPFSLSIGFLGTGRIAAPMVHSLNRRFPDSSLFVSERNRDMARELAQLPGVDVMANQELIDHSEVIFVCLLADVARVVLPKLRFRRDQKIISVMADIGLAEVGTLVAPARNPVVTVPLPFIRSGGCPLPVFPDAELIEQLFGDENEVIAVRDESAMGPHFAATAILSHTMKQMDVASEWLSEFTGSREDAERYMGTLVSGYLGSIEKDGQGRFLEAMEDLSTEGGLNNQLRAHIDQSGFYRVLREGMQLLEERSRKNAS